MKRHYLLIYFIHSLALFNLSEATIEFSDIEKNTTALQTALDNIHISKDLLSKAIAKSQINANLMRGILVAIAYQSTSKPKLPKS